MAIRYLHADGGLYRLAGVGKLKCPTTGDWLEAVFYHDLKGSCLLATTKERWEERFTLISQTKPPAPATPPKPPADDKQSKKGKKHG